MQVRGAVRGDDRSAETLMHILPYSDKQQRPNVKWKIHPIKQLSSLLSTKQIGLMDVFSELATCCGAIVLWGLVFEALFPSVSLQFPIVDYIPKHRHRLSP